MPFNLALCSAAGSLPLPPPPPPRHTPHNTHRSDPITATPNLNPAASLQIVRAQAQILEKGGAGAHSCSSAPAGGFFFQAGGTDGIGRVPRAGARRRRAAGGIGRRRGKVGVFYRGAVSLPAGPRVSARRPQGRPAPPAFVPGFRFSRAAWLTPDGPGPAQIVGAVANRFWVAPA